MFEFLGTAIPDCFEIETRIFDDLRGRFVKTFHREAFGGKGLNVDWAEEYYSISRRSVLRGLHFQLPPDDHEKLVYCTDGEVFDVVLDLRNGSPTYGEYATFHLSAGEAKLTGDGHNFDAFDTAFAQHVQSCEQPILT